jgi:hypothetical protein
MRSTVLGRYNGPMTTIDSPSPAPSLSVADSFLEALTARDFARLTAVLDPDASLSALVPRGFREWHGATEIGATFERWFGDVAAFEVADAGVGQVGPRLQLRWRIRVTGPRPDDQPMVVQQHVYVDTTPSGRIGHLSLLCSGFCPEPADA